ncbi:AAA family ATPase [Lachnospiraceae bacterium 46-15]
MITFNNTLDIAIQSICSWDKKMILSNVTLVRDVYGTVSFAMDNMETVADFDEQKLKTILTKNMGKYFSGRIYWKKLSGNFKNISRRIKPIIDLIEAERVQKEMCDNIMFFVSERPIAKKAWICRTQNIESVWPYEEAVKENGTKVVTFYSFKGGMGRTTALAGVVLTLVKQGKNVVMIDTDIEAPGLATLFFEEEIITKGVLDYLIEHEIDGGIQVEDYVFDVTDPVLLDEEDGRLFLMPAGKVDDNYLQKLARIDYQDNRENHLRDSLTGLLTDIKSRYSPDYIFVDARAGFHDMGGVAVTQLPHGVVLFGNDSRQSWDGIAQVLRTIAERHTEDFPIMIIDTMCPKPISSDFAISRKRFLQKSYTVCQENYYDAGSKLPGIEAPGEIHFPELIPFDDDLLRGIELFSDGSQEQNRQVGVYKDKLTGEIYEKVANRIAGWFGEA